MTDQTTDPRQAQPSFPDQPATRRRSSWRRRSLAMLAGTLALAGTFLAAAGIVQTIPPKPAIEPGPATGLDVHGFVNTGTVTDPVYEFTNPYVPPASTSLDNRIGLQRKMADSDPHPNVVSKKARFLLFSPERVTGPNAADPPIPSDPNVPLMESKAGATIVGDVLEKFDPDELHGNTSGGTISHLALCDPKATSNPTTCGNGDDCYNLKIITGLLLDSIVVDGNGDPILDDRGNPIPKRDLQFWSVPIEIVVETPKTRDAAIKSVTPTGQPLVGATIQGAPDPDLPPIVQGIPVGTPGIDTFHTPMIVGDNRLLVARIGARGRFTFDLSGNPTTGVWDSVYSHYSGGDECDVEEWDEFKPLAYAQVDPDLRVGTPPNDEPLYGFTQYPMRSPSGAAIPTVQDLRARYLWVDQAANNVFFGSLSRKLLDVSGTDDLYDTSCVSGPPCASSSNSESGAPHQGWMMMGLWTHGKMVLLDSMANHSDFGLRAEEENHRLVELFCADGGDYNDCYGPLKNRAEVRVGSGRDEAAFRDPDTATIIDPNPVGWIDTTVQFGSSEHFYNALPHMRPGVPRDVVWQITAGTRTDEIAFDDYMSHRTLVFSPMNGFKEMLPSNGTYYDGNGAGGVDMRLQNAATTLTWSTPDYGKVIDAETKTGRIENVALGGIKGRGFFLFENTGIEYEIPDTVKNNALPSKEWMVSLFYDLRKDPAGSIKRLVTFPSGAYFATHGTRFLRVCQSSAFCPISVELPKPLEAGKWTHLAFVLENGVGFNDDKVHIYQDGFLFETVDRPSNMKVEDGDLQVGSPDLPGAAEIAGIEGWIDEFKIVEGPFSPEEVCNHARGTLVAVPFTHGSGTGALQSLWQPFNDSASYEEPGRVAVHKALHGSGSKVWPLSDLYVCSIDYTTPRGVTLHDPGQGDAEARSIRRRLLFPEGPVVWNQPRPESRANQFCLSCHGAGEKGGLTLDALERKPTVLALNDDRRQPLQAPKTIFGEIPANYIADSKPPSPANNQSLDSWIDDGPLYQWTFDEGQGATPNWVIGDPDVGATGATRFGNAFHQKGEFRGHALTLDGVGDYARVDNKFDITGGGMTVATWFLFENVDGTTCVDTQANSRCTLLAKAGATDHWLLELYRDTAASDWKGRFKVSTVDQTAHELVADLPSNFDPAAWHHLAGTYHHDTASGHGRLELFLDGLSIDQEDLSASDLAADSSLWVTMGARFDAFSVPQHAMEGKIDDPRLWDRPLLDWEIEDLFDVTP